jgi:hypothetical protein
MKGIKAWRLRTEETPCMYETEYMRATDKWADDVNSTMYKEFRRTFRIPFGLYQDMVESAYALQISATMGRGSRRRRQGVPPLTSDA